MESLYELAEIELELVKDKLGMELVSRYGVLGPPVEDTAAAGGALVEPANSLFTVLVRDRVIGVRGSLVGFGVRTERKEVFCISGELAAVRGIGDLVRTGSTGYRSRQQVKIVTGIVVIIVIAVSGWIGR